MARRLRDWEMKDMNIIASICDSLILPRHLKGFGDANRTMITQTVNYITGQLDIILSVLAIVAAIMVVLAFLY